MSSGLSRGGQTFFGSLCLGTFGLGCWQTNRYFEKVEEIKLREREITYGPPQPLEAYASNDEKSSNYRLGRKVCVEGAFRHSDEVLVGPRGAPKSAGLKKGRKAQGMAQNPQGYFVVVPLERSDGKGTVLVKRGWVPYSFLQKNIVWSRPSGIVNVHALVDQCERPKSFSPLEHPSLNRLIWFDRKAIEKGTKTAGLDPLLLTQVDGDGDGPTPNSDDPRLMFPMKASVDALKEFTITPEIHMSYAITWFGLSAAGVLMTKKLMLRGRG